MEARTRQFALRVMKLIDALPNTIKGRVLADQLLRSATSIAANYRASSRARSRAEFISKISTCLEEADEAWFWLDLIQADGLLPASRLTGLLPEAEELVKILAATRSTALKNRNS
ncbi:MAG: four helix bundle protein [Limisphaerales bacterium]